MYMRLAGKENYIVSILSPCWNGEKFIGRMLESILSQSYKNIEMICIDDGSTDHTKEVILSYEKKFKEQGMNLIYVWQTNQGQAAAINHGLKLISGEYLSWIDCDDFLTHESVEKKLAFLLEHPDYSIVTSNFYQVKEPQIGGKAEEPGKLLGNLNYQPNQFYLTLAGLSTIECMCHMLRVKDLKKINTDMNIAICQEGQNYQILLPMYYHYKRGYIEEALAYYVIRENSHYHRKRTYKEWLDRYEALQEMLRETLGKMGMNNAEIEKHVKLSYFYTEQRRLMDDHGGN